jgi:soluble lytic murein transglycosylase-like protein
MRKFLLAGLSVLLAGLSPFAAGSSVEQYLKLRKQHGITQAVGVAALETLLGSRIVEVKGKVKGIVRVGQSGSLLLEKTDGDTMFVNCEVAPDWISGNDMAVRLIVRAERSSEHADLRAQLVAAVPEAPIANLEAAEAAKRTAATRTAAKPPANANLPSPTTRTKEWNLPASDAVPIYANFIKRRNSRLSEQQATKIAEGIIGFSLQYGVDARLIMAMVMVESGFNPNATSRAGAMGLGQLMPGTARGMGVTNAYDTHENLYGTVKLIRGHLDKYKKQTGEDFQSLVLALAAYNAGPGAVSRHRGVPPYRETQNYVRKVTDIYRQLAGG